MDKQEGYLEESPDKDENAAVETDRNQVIT